MRDLCRSDEALALATEAHDLEPHNYMPCTLIGALHMESGDLLAGREWYQKAEQLGAPREAIDSELRALIARSGHTERKRILDFLLLKDADRFGHLARDGART